MNLFIETENGAAKNHPAFEDNLIEAFGSVPTHWEAFTRVERPVPTLYQTFDSPEFMYAQVNGVWTDVWLLRDMTTEEVAVKQQAAKDSWLISPNWSSWVFNETTCAFEAPIAYPNNGKAYVWDESTTNWAEVVT